MTRPISFQESEDTDLLQNFSVLQLANAICYLDQAHYREITVRH